MNARPALFLTLALVTSGCTLLGGNKPAETAMGPHLDVLVQVDGPRGANVNITLFQLNEARPMGEFFVTAGGSQQRSIQDDLLNPGEVRMRYTVTEGGRGATGGSTAPLDPAKCAGTYRATFTIHTRETIVSAGSTGTCIG